MFPTLKDSLWFPELRAEDGVLLRAWPHVRAGTQ